MIRTEILIQREHGSFVKSASIDYNFEIQQKCRFEVYSVPDVSSEDISTYEFLGS